MKAESVCDTRVFLVNPVSSYTTDVSTDTALSTNLLFSLLEISISFNNLIIINILILKDF